MSGICISTFVNTVRVSCSFRSTVLRIPDPIIRPRRTLSSTRRSPPLNTASRVRFFTSACRKQTVKLRARTTRTAAAACIFSKAHVFPAERNVLRHHTPLTLAGHCGALSMHKLSIKKGKNAISFVLLSFRTGTVTQMGSRPVSRRLRRKQYEKRNMTRFFFFCFLRKSAASSANPFSGSRQPAHARLSVRTLQF